MGSPAPTFGELLKKHRLASGLSQEGLAEHARVSAGAIGALEQGARRAPYRETVSRLADALAVSGLDRRDLESAAERARGRRQSVEAPAGLAGTLPVRLTSFLGRHDEDEKIRALLRTGRLVTLTGSGGIGKTRMAIETARGLLETGRHGDVRFVDLAPLRDGSFLAESISGAFALPAPPSADALRALTANLRERACLLVLDNCEHLVDAVADTVAALLAGCPEIVVLATSRERLAIEGERVHRLPSLAVPAETPVTIEQAGRFASLALFFDRAAAAGSALPSSTAHLESAARICRALEGIPLAIELAASRVPSLGLAGLERRLNDHLSIAGAGRDLPERHHTMTATIAWSYELLRDPEQTLLRRLAVFRGGVTIEAVESAGDDLSLHRDETFDLLSSLCDKSLLTMTAGDERVRYGMLEVVRAFLVERLRESGELRAAKRAHLRRTASIAEEANEQTARVSRHDWLRTYGPELDDARAALGYALDDGDADDAVFAARIVGGLRALWIGTWRRAECRQWCRAALARIDEERHPDVTATLLRAYVQSASGRELISVAERALLLLERIGDRQGMTFVRASLALEHSKMGHVDEAERDIARSLALAADAALSARAELLLLEYRWQIRLRSGRLEEARPDLRRHAALVHQLGDEAFDRLTLCYFEGCVEFAARNVARTAELFERSIDVWSRDELVAELRVRLVHAAAAYLVLGRLDAADEMLRTALDGVAGEGYSEPFWHAVQHLAALRALRGHVRSAARLAGFVRAWGAENDRVPDLFGRSSMSIVEDALRREMPSAAAAALAGAGATIALHQAVEEALA